MYRPAVDQFLNEELPEFEQDDAQMYLDLYVAEVLASSPFYSEGHCYRMHVTC
jgi:hypothetical protein